MNDGPGEVLDQRFQVLTHLGGGGMGEVYQCLEIALKRIVAVKVLPASALNDSESRARFLKEGVARVLVFAAPGTSELVAGHTV